MMIFSFKHVPSTLSLLTLSKYDNFIQFQSLFMKQQLDKVGNNPTKSCSNILKKLFEKDLILQFTALKKVVDKEFVFKASTCFQILKSKYKVCSKK